MGLFQRALETYDALEKTFAGVYQSDKAEPLAPIGHIVTKAAIDITIDADGNLVELRAAEKDRKILIPVTEDSASRAGKFLPAHPLCDQLGYLLEEDVDKHRDYMAKLTAWAESAYTHPKVKAVLRYMTRGTLRADLTAANMQDPSAKDLVCWRVIGLGADSGPVWTDVALMQAYSSYYLSTLNREAQLCLLTGETCPTTRKHLKGVFSLNGNAKLISANDEANFTYRGRFLEPDEAASVGYAASQKAHNALKWLVSNHGSVQGNRVFVCWNPQGHEVPRVTDPFAGLDEGAPAFTFQSYREDLRRKLEGYQVQWGTTEQVIIAAFDAATTGRLAVTYYNELLGSDFLSRLAAWDESCCWQHGKWGVSSPLLYTIIAYAFGTLRNKDAEPEPDKKLLAPQMQRLIACRIDQAAFPLDIMQAIVARAGNMQLYDKNRTKLLCTACAVIRKYHIDHFKEEIKLALEPESADRSYQWGRMLAILEKIERDTYDSDEKREPNAIRMQQVFVQRPGYAFDLVMTQLKTAYYPRLRPGARSYYDRLVGEVMEQLSCDMDAYNDALTETYLPGYYLQRNALYTKKEREEKEETNDEI